MNKPSISAMQLIARRYGRVIRGRVTQCVFPEKHTHGDRRPSLVISQDGQRAKCFARDCLGGWQDAIGILQRVEALTFEAAADLIQQPTVLHLHPLAKKALVTPQFSPRYDVRPTIIRRFKWISRNGQILWHLRWDPEEPTKFSWAWDSDGKQHCKADRPCPPLGLYRQDELKHATIVVMCEGEHDADTVTSIADRLGMSWIRGTCTPNGANHVEPDFITMIPKRARIVVSGHRDPAGTDYMNRWESVGHTSGRRITRFPVLEMPGCKDWAEWLEEGAHPATFAVELLRALGDPHDPEPFPPTQPTRDPAGSPQRP